MYPHAISIHQNYAIRASRDAFSAKGILYVCNIIEMIWKLCVLCIQQGLDESDQMIRMTERERESQSYRANERPFVILNSISFRWFAGKSHLLIYYSLDHLHFLRVLVTIKWLSSDFTGAL